MLVSAVQMDVVAGDVRGNMARAYRHVEVAVRRGSRVILLPEMWSTGFYYSDLVGAARAAGARSVLVPTEVTLPDEVADAPVVCPDLLAAATYLLGNQVLAEAR